MTDGERGDDLVGELRAVERPLGRGLNADDDLAAVDLLEQDGRLDRVGVVISSSRIACTWLGRTPDDSRTLTSTDRAP